MGVYIKGAKKPTECRMCIFIEPSLKNGKGKWSHRCFLTLKPIEESECPLIEMDIVRCGECRNFIDDKSVFADGLCKLHLNRHKNKDDYCSKGIRMEEEDE